MTTGIAELSGRVRDTDAHEFTPAHLWAEVYGDEAGAVAQMFLQIHDPDGQGSLAAPVDRDEAPISPETMGDAWQKFAYAPGAFDMKRRVEVLDLVGIEQTFIFSSGPGFFGLVATTGAADRMKAVWDIAIDDETLRRLGQTLIRSHNDWCAQVARISSRLRPVAVLDTNDIDEAVEEVERVHSMGIRALGISAAMPPGGLSPGNRGVDPLWEVLAEKNIPVLLHGGTDLTVLRNHVWPEYGPSNVVGKYQNPELVLDPHSISQFPLGAQNFLGPMIFGGVFDRFPTLRVGCIEVSAYWIGPMAENIDNVGAQFRRTSELELKPSEYLSRNVRVNPFWWEPVDKYIDRYGLEDVYVYGSDYPHYEGGDDPAKIFQSRLQRHGQSVLEKFFVTNADLLMP